MNKKIVSLLFFTLILTGCQGNIKSPDTTQPIFINSSKVVSEPAVKKIFTAKKRLSATEKITLKLIRKGELALAEKRLLTPENDNANMYFQAALGRDPGNFKAIQGIATIVDLYTQWAWKAAKSRDYKTAARYLDFARLANPEDVVITEAASRIKNLKIERKSSAKKPLEVLKEGQYKLPKNLFSLSDNEIIAKIQPIIDKVEKTKQSLVIYWPIDKEARLIYQIINSRVTDFRVRGMIYHRTDYMVELQKN